MYNNYLDILVAAHSGGRWILLLLLLVAIFKSATAGNRNFTDGDAKTGLFLMIVTDLMLLVGLVLYFAGNWGFELVSGGGMGEVMKNPVARFFSVEHTVGMLIAIVLIHIGKAQAKKNLPHRSKHKRTFIFYLLALIIIIASVPWPIRAVGEGRGWF
ncbi:MAG TPA: hypothetical protein VGB56_07515 [Flavisolibacter sp.]|jgi:hypothetical protein